MEGAKTYYKKVLDLVSKHPGAHNNLANIYVAEGKNEEAIEHYKEALKFMPNNFNVVYHLSLLEPEVIDTNLKNNIKKNLKNKNINKRNKSYANFLLSKYENRSKDYKKEIFHLNQAHKLYLDSEIKKLTPAKYWLKNLPEINFLNTLKCHVKSNNINPIFIFGLPRSGSTLIENIIASSSDDILVGEESDIINFYFKEKILKNKNINFNDQDIQLDIINSYKKKNLIKNNSSIFTDKSLENFFFLDLIKTIFPNVKLVNCNRKPLSSLMSIFKNNLVNLSWAHNTNNILKYFNSYYEKIDVFKNKNPNMIYDIHYEKLVHEPEMETKKLLNFCGLEWNEKCLEFYKRKNLISKTTSNIQIRKPIYKDSSNKYEPYMKFFLKYKKKYKWLV
jgi:tetratricopeptide (TPR) repeat protein